MIPVKITAAHQSGYSKDHTDAWQMFATARTQRAA